jgi:hypothetical protein
VRWIQNHKEAQNSSPNEESLGNESSVCFQNPAALSSTWSACQQSLKLSLIGSKARKMQMALKGHRDAHDNKQA